MNTFEPGRVYSIVIDGKADLYVWSGDSFVGAYHTVHPGAVTDIRGPLVVLDLGEYDRRGIIDGLRTANGYLADDIADQIEEQTRPPLQDGWHEVTSENVGGPGVRRWDGTKWRAVPGYVDATQDWTSTHYIGPGSQS